MLIIKHSSIFSWCCVCALFFRQAFQSSGFLVGKTVEVEVDVAFASFCPQWQCIESNLLTMNYAVQYLTKFNSMAKWGHFLEISNSFCNIVYSFERFCKANGRRWNIKMYFQSWKKNENIKCCEDKPRQWVNTSVNNISSFSVFSIHCLPSFHAGITSTLKQKKRRNRRRKKTY